MKSSAFFTEPASYVAQVNRVFTAGHYTAVVRHSDGNYYECDDARSTGTSRLAQRAFNHASKA